MRRRSWAGLIGLALLTMLGLLIWGLWPASVPDPVVQGHPLSAWLVERQRHPDGSITLTDRATEAVRSLGADAAPTLLAFVERRDPMLVRGTRLVGRVLHLSHSLTAIETTRRGAALGLRALGPAARPVWPALATLALQTSDDGQLRDALDALTGADASTMQRLAEGTNSRDRNVRSRAVRCLMILRIAPSEVILPALERLRDDPDTAVQAQVALAIPDLLGDLPRYAALLGAPEPERRVAGAHLLGGFEGRARKFLPHLRVATNDVDPAVRAAVAEAIRRIEGPNPTPPGAEGPVDMPPAPMPPGPATPAGPSTSP